MHWTSIKKHHPPEPGIYLCWTTYAFDIRLCWDGHQWSKFGVSAAEWSRAVTHWMKVNPPKEGE